jgi:RNA polymerase sigma-70 factor (ECF subfamily)
MSDVLAMTGPSEDAPLDQRLVAELPAVRAFLRRLTGGRGEAEDLAQEVVARALRYRRAFDGERELGPWLRGTALRVFLDHRERRRRAPGELGEAPASRERHEELVEDRDAIERHLAKLSAVERDVVLRFHGRGESIREIAAALALPEGTVKSHLHRARRRIGGSEGS